MQTAVLLEPKLSEYAMPPRDSAAVVASLLYQADRHQPIPPYAGLSHAVDEAAAVYPTSRPPPGFTREECNLKEIKREIRRTVLQDVRPMSTPGVPLQVRYPDNAAARLQAAEQIVNAAMARCQLLMSTCPDEVFHLSPVELVQRGFCDPVKLFVKNEGHTKVKIETGRVRLISSISLVDQLVERIMSSNQNSAEKERWRDIPSACGIGFTQDDIDAMYKYVADRPGQPLETDISGFDWSVHYFELAADVEVRLRLNGCSRDSPFGKLLTNRVRCLAASVFVLPDGRMVAQSLPGVQKSGSFNTSPTNSRIRYMMARAIGARWAKTHGDDCVEDAVKDGQQKYAAQGRICKSYKLCPPKQFEFCSHRYDGETAINVNWVKGLFNLLANRNHDPQLLEDFKREHALSPQLGWCLAVIYASGWGGVKTIDKDVQSAEAHPATRGCPQAA
jgi:hypothetical protein